MLDKLDLELFKILDSEIDKTLNFGCYIILDNGEVRQDLGKYIYTKESVFLNRLLEPVCLGDYKILGHYPTTNEVLMYCQNNKWHYDITTIYDGINLIINDHKDDVIRNNILDITKPIQQYTDEQKEELILFLKSI